MLAGFYALLFGTSSVLVEDPRYSLELDSADFEAELIGATFEADV